MMEEGAWELPWGLSIDALAASRRHSRDTSPQSALSQARRALLQRHLRSHEQEGGRVMALEGEHQPHAGGSRHLTAPFAHSHK